MTQPHINEWLDCLHSKVLLRAPELVDLYATYAEEARFGRSFIDSNLQALSKGSSILEVGAGSLILSTQLVKEGYLVTALEPTGEGFSHFDKLRGIVMEQAREDNCLPQLIEIPAESLQLESQFDLAFSINVMEHVKSIEMVINRVVLSLTTNGTYRFTCPNYLFPYEPHFNIPILISKKLTHTVFENRIANCEGMQDPLGVWNSLNWITVQKIKRVVQLLNLAPARFDKRILTTMLSRVVSDTAFSARRSRWAVVILTYIVRLRLHKATLLIPAIFHPVIDCTLAKKR